MISAPEKPPVETAINMAEPDARLALDPKKPREEQLALTKFIPLTIATLLAVATALECHSLSGAPASLLSWVLSLAYGCILWVWWAAVAEVLWRTGNRRPGTLSVSLKTVSAQVLVALGVVSLHLSLLHISTRSMAKVGPTIAREGYADLNFFCLPRIGLELLIYGLIWFACSALHTQLTSRREAMRSLELEKQLSSAHLRALQMQLEPHFLFNTLNAVTTLMELNRREEALETLAHLNIVLKTVLKRNTPSKIPLVQELEIVESYLAIERVRFADRLRFDLDLDASVLDGLVPCFLLQPIVENAIRHGIARCENEGCIETSAKRVGDRMQLQVRDNGPGVDGGTRSGFGVGLVNTRERLNHFYQDDYELRTSQPESGGFEVSITIPFERTAP
jgi:hypothetical protein